MTHLVGISGSLRVDASNTLLINEAARLFEPELFTLADLNLPLLNTDLMEDGVPEAVARLADVVRKADGVVISTPEYNKMIPGVLKNALDWLSILPDGNPLKAMPVAIMSSAAGRSGGERAQYTLRHALTPHGAHLIPLPEVMIAGANGAFAEDGTLREEKSQALLGTLLDALKAEIALRG